MIISGMRKLSPDIGVARLNLCPELCFLFRIISRLAFYTDSTGDNIPLHLFKSLFPVSGSK